MTLGANPGGPTLRQWALVRVSDRFTGRCARRHHSRFEGYSDTTTRRTFVRSVGDLERHLVAGEGRVLVVIADVPTIERGADRPDIDGDLVPVTDERVAVAISFQNRRTVPVEATVVPWIGTEDDEYRGKTCST